MPMYEYHCKQCGTKFEILRGITATDKDIKCPKCGAAKPEKLFSITCGANLASNKGNLHIPT
jgi:putative FmdB family regulatory protein